jgi:hypothetical protein
MISEICVSIWKLLYLCNFWLFIFYLAQPNKKYLMIDYKTHPDIRYNHLKACLALHIY